VRAFPVLVAAALAAVAVVVLASAHAQPARVRPGDGAVVTTPPPVVQIEMTQELARQAGANDIEVFNEAGAKVTTVAAVIDNGNRRLLSVPLPSTIEPGRYIVRWKTLSAEDGDTDSGELSFTYDPAGTPDPGREILAGTVATPAPAPTGGAEVPAFVERGGARGVSWVLVAAVGLGMFVLGSGTTFLLVQRRP
jgi:methionine-rich copper-binding protein CopC